MKKIFALFLFCTIAFTSFSQRKSKNHKVVIQFVSADTLSQYALVNNLKNLREGWPTAQIEVVFHGPGIAMALPNKTKFNKELQDFVENKNIVMVVCENTMKQRKITKEQLLPFMGSVPMGIGEIIMKQEAGWAYLKGGL